MELCSWLERTRTPRSAFSRAVGVSPGRITQICEGEMPSLDLADLRDAAGRDPDGARKRATRRPGAFEPAAELHMVYLAWLKRHHKVLADLKN